MTHPEPGASDVGSLRSISIAHSGSNVADTTPPTANDIPHSESTALVHLPNVTKASASTQDANFLPGNPSPGHNKISTEKVWTLEKYEELKDLIWGSRDVQPFLDRNPNFNLDCFPEKSFPCGLLLHEACRLPEVENIKRLIAAGAKPEAFCGNGRNAIQCTICRGTLNEDILEYLTENYPSEMEKITYVNSFDMEKNLRATHYVAESFRRPLYAAQALTKLGADWTLENREKFTPFEWAAKHSNWVITSYLTDMEWADGRGDLVTDSVNDGYNWLQVCIQNTAFIQGLVWNKLKDVKGREDIVKLITPDFRLNRDSEDPVGGNGRESLYFSTKLDDVDFASIAIPYFSTEAITDIQGRKSKYKQNIRKFGFYSKRNFNYHGFQCASSLDEYCYPSLDEKSLTGRNADQVLSRYQKEKLEEERIVTVPQLWIWTVDKILVTATHKPIPKELLQETYAWIFAMKLTGFSPAFRISYPRARDLLAGILISDCVDYLDSPARLGLKHSILSIFEISLSELYAKVLEYTKSQALSKTGTDSEKDFVFQISDIREELSMIQNVVFEQEEVWRQFINAKFPEFYLKDQFCITPEILANVPIKDLELEALKIIGRPQTQFARYKGRIAKLNEDAERIERFIILQLDLKSKHASLKEAHLTTLMSAAIIGFSVVTIIFTPLSFLASFFALSTSVAQAHQYNSTLLNGPPVYRSSDMTKWMISIEAASLGVTGFAVYLALRLMTKFSFRRFVKNGLNSIKHEQPVPQKPSVQKTEVIKEHASPDGQNPEVSKEHASPGVPESEVSKEHASPDGQKSEASKEHAPSGEKKQSIRNRFDSYRRKRPQQHEEAGIE